MVSSVAVGPSGREAERERVVGHEVVPRRGVVVQEHVAQLLVGQLAEAAGDGRCAVHRHRAGAAQERHPHHPVLVVGRGDEAAREAGQLARVDEAVEGGDLLGRATAGVQPALGERHRQLGVRGAAVEALPVVLHDELPVALLDVRRAMRDPRRAAGRTGRGTARPAPAAGPGPAHRRRRRRRADRRCPRSAPRASPSSAGSASSGSAARSAEPRRRARRTTGGTGTRSAAGPCRGRPRR